MTASPPEPTQETDDIFLHTLHVLASQIKLDITKALESGAHPNQENLHMLLEQLMDENTINGLIAELAQEELTHTLKQGQQPSVHMLRLAGFPHNKHPET